MGFNSYVEEVDMVFNGLVRGLGSINVSNVLGDRKLIEETVIILGVLGWYDSLYQ